MLSRTWEGWISRYVMCSFQSVLLLLLFVLIIFCMVQKFGGMGDDAMGGMDFSVCDVLS